MKIFSSAFVLVALVLVLVSGSTSVARAADLGGWGWNDYGTYDEWSDYGTYDNWSDYGTYDNWSDYGTYDNWSDYGTYGGYTDTYHYDDPVSYTDYYYDDPSYTDYYYDDPTYTDYYYDDYYPTYSQGGGYDYGCGSSCGGGYSSWVPSYSQPARPSGGSSSYYNSNTVTNTNINNINNTNIDNSIRDSFNNYNSGNTSIVVATPQVPVVHTTPAPYCTINHALSGGHYGHNNSAYLSWSSTNASSAYLSNVGSVEVSGSRTVYSGHATTYTLTVYGYNGQSATCSTTVQGYTYTPPTYIPPVVQQPYVSLTQIPYTGFDLGPIGNSLYWVGLMAFALAGSYLMIYYRGGALAFAGAMLPRTQKPLPAVVAPKAPILVEKEAAALRAEEARVAPIVASLRKAAGTNDSMAIIKANDGSMPRIVINRS